MRSEIAPRCERDLAFALLDVTMRSLDGLMGL